ncbi:MAG: hypothetical protein U0841_16000 [Chloroflexia bacterium]
MRRRRWRGRRPTRRRLDLLGLGDGGAEAGGGVEQDGGGLADGGGVAGEVAEGVDEHGGGEAEARRTTRRG